MADEQQVWLYLESTCPRNRALYLRHGFKAYKQVGPTPGVWCLPGGSLGGDITTVLVLQFIHNGGALHELGKSCTPHFPACALYL